MPLAGESTPKRILITILVVATLVRVAVFAVAAQDTSRMFTTDAHHYVDLANDLRRGYMEPGSRLFYIGLARPPAYPLFLALLPPGGPVEPLLVVPAQILISLLTLWLLFRWTAALLGTGAGLGAAAMLAIEPVTVLHTSYLLSESLYVAVFVAAMATFWRWLRTGSPLVAAVAGSLVGASVLIRPIGLFLPLVLLFIALVYRVPPRKLLTGAGSLLIGFIIVVAPWVIRNRVVTGHTFVSAVESYNLLNRAAGSLGTARGIAFIPARRELRSIVNERLGRPEDTGLFEAPTVASLMELLDVEREVALDTFSRFPTQTMISAVRGSALVVLGPGRETTSRLLGVPSASFSGRSAVVLAAGLMVGIYVAALGGIWILRRREPQMVLALLALSAYFVVLSSDPGANSRYRAPVMPLVAILAGAGLTKLRPVRAIEEDA